MKYIEFILFSSGSAILYYSEPALVEKFVYGFYPPIIIVFSYILYVNMVKIFALAGEMEERRASFAYKEYLAVTLINDYWMEANLRERSSFYSHQDKG